MATNISYSLIMKEETVDTVNEADADYANEKAAAIGEEEQQKDLDNKEADLARNPLISIHDAASVKRGYTLDPNTR